MDISYLVNQVDEEIEMKLDHICDDKMETDGSRGIFSSNQFLAICFKFIK